MFKHALALCLGLLSFSALAMIETKLGPVKVVRRTFTVDIAKLALNCQPGGAGQCSRKCVANETKANGTEIVASVDRYQTDTLDYIKATATGYESVVYACEDKDIAAALKALETEFDLKNKPLTAIVHLAK